MLRNLIFQRVSLKKCRRRYFTTHHHAPAIRCAIVGSGPSGFYTAKYLFEKHPSLRIDVIDMLPTPFGLVRQGVAPDHPEVKSVIETFSQVASNDRFRYFGNITVGDKGVSIAELKKAYNAIVLAYGASSDLSLNIPGETLGGVMGARSFVNWYNGHPMFTHIGNQIDLKKTKRVVIIGNGNVAIDCARILTKRPDELAVTDISTHALTALRDSGVEEVVVLGRRGHAQASFTIKELRELTRLKDVNVRISSTDIEAGNTASTLEELKDNRPKTRIVDLIKSVAAASEQEVAEPTMSEVAAASAKKEEESAEDSPREDAGKRQKKKEKTINLRFLWSPKEILPRQGDDGKKRVGAVVIERNRLEGPAERQRAIPTGVTETVEADLVLKSVGYKCEPIADVPFNARTNTVPHIHGRVVEISTGGRSSSSSTAGKTVPHISVTSAGDVADAKVVPGLYVTGWLKRGPSGIIGSNIADAKETATSIVEDLASTLSLSSGTSSASSLSAPKVDPVSVLPALREETVVDWSGHLKIDAEEVRRGQASSPAKPREKIVYVGDLVRVANEETL